MTTKELQAQLNAARDKAADKYQQDDFALNPNGYTVAPYVNRETTATAFCAGHDSLAPLVIELAEALIEANEFTSSILEDMEHYFENKCCPTADEVNQAAIADSMIRLARGKLEAYLNGGGK